MADLKMKIINELQSIDIILTELQNIKDKPVKSMVELSGIGALLMSFYSGVENILKMELKLKNIQITQTSSWHKDLLNSSAEKGIITSETRESLSEYMAFRHFFVHSYGFNLRESELNILLKNLDDTYKQFKSDVVAQLE